MYRNFASRYKLPGSDQELACVIRAPPNKLRQNDVTIIELDQIECPVPFSENEELASAILDITGSTEDDQSKASSRLPVFCLRSVLFGK